MSTASHRHIDTRIVPALLMVRNRLSLEEFHQFFRLRKLSPKPAPSVHGGPMQFKLQAGFLQPSRLFT